MQSVVQVGIEWDGSTAEKYIGRIMEVMEVGLCPEMSYQGIGINATGDGGAVLGDIQFSTADHGGTNSYTIIIELQETGTRI